MTQCWRRSLGEIPEIFTTWLIRLSYAENSISTNWMPFKISSEEGFLARWPPWPTPVRLNWIYPILQSLVSKFKMGYLDDVAAGGMLPPFLKTFKQLGTDRALEMGLPDLNVAKCEIICTENDTVPPIFTGFLRLLPTECELLGAPLPNWKGTDSLPLGVQIFREHPIGCVCSAPMTLWLILSTIRWVHQ